MEFSQCKTKSNGGKEKTYGRAIILYVTCRTLKKQKGTRFLFWNVNAKLCKNKQYETSIEDSSNKDIDVINNLEFYKQFYESTDEFDNITEEENIIEQNNHDDDFQI